MAAAVERALAEADVPLPLDDEWTVSFVRKLQLQHARVREFLQSPGDRGLQIAADIARHIERLQAEIDALSADNALHRAQPAASPANFEAVDGGEKLLNRHARVMDEIRELNVRNSKLQRQLQAARAAPRGGGPSPEPECGGDWESQKRRLLADLVSKDEEEEAVERRWQIEEIVALTGQIIADKDLEIEELKHLLDAQSGSRRSLALGAEALGHVFDQDDIIREERQRLELAQNELREKRRQAEVEHSMERARLARREAEIEERLRSGAPQLAADAKALASTGRPVRGRWRTKLGLADDGPAADRGRHKKS